MNKNILVQLFIYLFGSKFDIIEKVVRAVFYINIFDFITHFYNAFINIKLLLIHYFCNEIVITVLLDILSNNIKYKQLRL